MRSLWTGASGMTAQQFNIDTIANNLSNVNTVGFKKGRADFEDLIYQNLRLAGTPSSVNTEYPTGVQVGLGIKTAATQKMYTQGTPQKTENKLDIAVMGEGFFKVRLNDGSFAYTRNGSFKVDANGDLVTSDGYYLEPPIRFDLDVLKDSISISEEGFVTFKTGTMPPDGQPKVAGEVKLYRFVNPTGLKNIGKNLVKETAASGQEFEGSPTSQGFGKLFQGFLEMSNVQIVEEMVSMIVAQRAYEFNSKAIQTSDSMLKTAVELKR
ncbi:MAG: flagellar basal-body rod protein FlgG [Spirochaetota bacterium]|nr:flagellar basal-body rod protein FlgG [Spirochaetota bacterium]